MKMLGFILGLLLIACEMAVAGLWVLMEWLWETGWKAGAWVCNKVASCWRRPDHE